MSVSEPVLQTRRLILRPPCLQDFDAFAAMMADERVARFLGGAQPRSAAWRALMTLAGAWCLQGFAMFSVIERATGRWVGRLGPWFPEGWPGPEIGWAVIHECWGRGYATEGATAALDWAFDTLGWTQAIHVIAPGNPASQAVARKLGARNRGPGRLPPPIAEQPLEIWGQTRDQWRARRAIPSTS